MAIRMHEFVPIDDAPGHGFQLIEEVFGPHFYVEDETGQPLTTLRNRRLLGHARQLLEPMERGAAVAQRDEVRRLSELADIVTPADYRRARDRDIANAILPWDFDHTESAGSLE